MSTVSGVNKKILVQWAVTIFLTVIIMLIPVNEVFTSSIRSFLAITVCCIFLVAFEVLPLTVPALLMPAAWCVSGVPTATAFAGFVNNTFWLIVGGFVLANGLEECGLLKRIAFAIIKRMSGSFNKLLFALYFVGVIISIMAVGNGYTVVIPLAFGICKSLNLKRGEESALIMMTAGFACTTSKLFVYNPNYLSLAEAGVTEYFPDFQVLYPDLTILNWPFLVVSLFMIYLMTKITHSSKYNIEGAQEFFDTEHAKMGKMSSNEKKAGVLLVLLLVYLIGNPLIGTPVAWGFMIIPYLFFFPGISVATEASIKRLNIGLLFFIASCLSIGTVANYVGINVLIQTYIIPLLNGASYFSFMIIIALLAGVANLLLTPLAIMTLFSGPIANICYGLGFEPLGAILALIEGTNIFFFPHEIAFLLMLYGFGMVSMKNFVKWSTYASVVGFIGFFALCVPWHMLIGAY